ncbi:kinase-like protein [Stachybotrys elegans]|uniref:Kinase-like protein n=1 Tax=Stachybotrys elegans TaxID=80388 RepID=A0A8K0WMH1_9HYPO|nr:kinase-like protein [Stachybotrys elegans]
MAYSHKSSSSSSPQLVLQPRQYAARGFEVIPLHQMLEEEGLPFYNIEDYYPVQIGQVIKDRYQVVAKLGYGGSSTVWLARDLTEERKYWVLKVYVNTLKHNQELRVYEHLSSVESDYPGRGYVRRFEEWFKLDGPHGKHDVVVMAPLGMSLRTLQGMQPTHAFQPMLVKSAISQVLLGIVYLHEAGVIHTDLHSDNLLVALTSDNILSKVEEEEILHPSARKRINDTIIYVSRYMLGGAGVLTICDLGQAMIGAEHRGIAMPTQYRAPEVILGMPWGNAVDLWSVGLLAWDLLEPKPLFRVFDDENPELNEAHHLAAMTALLGPPPLDFLKAGEKAGKYWTVDGEWKGPVPLPPKTSFESLVTTLTGEEKELFIDLIQRLLSWDPQERLSALVVYFHVWLRGREAAENIDSNTQ